MQNRRTHGRQWRKILGIDDDEQQGEIAASMLLRLRYEPQTGTSEEEAFSAIVKQSVDLLLLDMIMPPGMGGREPMNRTWQYGQTRRLSW
ncbi:MAG: response regulator [Desulfobulbaceae bacterium]|nr:response regulator [Desulfobulbaceae bacterium]